MIFFKYSKLSFFILLHRIMGPYFPAMKYVWKHVACQIKQ